MRPIAILFDLEGDNYERKDKGLSSPPSHWHNHGE